MTRPILHPRYDKTAPTVSDELAHVDIDTAARKLLSEGESA